jgi:type I restriction enzyme S subunit
MADGGTKLLRPGNLHVSGRVQWTVDNTRHMPHEWALEHPRFLVGPRELVMNLTAQSLKDEFLGRVCLTDDGERCLLNQRIARITPVGISPQFCLWLFKSGVFRRYVEDGLNTGSLIQHMFTSQVEDFVFPLPPEAEQSRFISAIENRLAFRASVSESVAAAGMAIVALTPAILAKAFRGELVPQDPNDEPASKLLARIRPEREGDSRAPRRTRQQHGTGGKR